LCLCRALFSAAGCQQAVRAARNRQSCSSLFGLVTPSGQGLPTAPSKISPCVAFPKRLASGLQGTPVGVTVVHPGGVGHRRLPTQCSRHRKGASEGARCRNKLARAQRCSALPPCRAAEIILAGCRAGTRHGLLVGNGRTAFCPGSSVLIASQLLGGLGMPGIAGAKQLIPGPSGKQGLIVGYLFSIIGISLLDHRCRACLYTRCLNQANRVETGHAGTEGAFLQFFRARACIIWGAGQRGPDHSDESTGPLAAV